MGRVVIEFYPLPLDKIDEEDLKWLKKALKDESPDAVREQLLDGRAVLWRYCDEERRGRGVVLVQELYDEIFLWHVGGINLRPGMIYILDTMAEFAKLRGKQSVRCLVPKALLKPYARAGMKLQYYMLRREV